MSAINLKLLNEEIEASQANLIHSPEAFVAIDYNFIFLFVNKTAEKFYNKSKEELLGKKVQDVFPDQWGFGPFRNARQSVDTRKYVEINYNSPFTNAWVQLIGRPFENYYTFTYKIIDHKEELRRELRNEVTKSNNR
jgi:PAS domain S-box-containing protein